MNHLMIMNDDGIFNNDHDYETSCFCANIVLLVQENDSI